MEGPGVSGPKDIKLSDGELIILDSFKSCLQWNHTIFSGAELLDNSLVLDAS